MNGELEEKVWEALKGVRFPGMSRDIVSFGFVRVDVCRGGNTGRVDRLQLLGVGKDVGELFREDLFLVRRELEVRERSDALYVGNRQRCGHVLDGTTALTRRSTMAACRT